MKGKAKILVMFFVVWVIVSITTGQTVFLEAANGSIASAPIPADGAVIPGDIMIHLGNDYIWTELIFVPGATAVKHTGYFSDDYSKVESRVQDANYGPPPYPIPGWEYTFFAGNPSAPPDDNTLVRGRTYYWCVDETDALGTTYPGDVWEFTIQDYKAFAPNPNDGQTSVSTTPILSWQAGFGAEQHDIYFGTSFDDVNDSWFPNLPVIQPPPWTQPVGDEDWDPITDGGLTIEFGTTYYWRIDEVGGRMPYPIGGGTYYYGDVWSFTTVIPVGEKTYHVDGATGDNTNDGLTPGTAFATIQKGIDTAIDGDTVIVYPGLYTENINFLGKNITVTSTNPDDPMVVASTIIQGTGAGPVVTFSGSESQSCMLDGLTITDGNTTGDGGGISGNGTEATIANCVITNNHADGVGGGVSNSNGRIVRCTITGNTADGDGLDGGGGIYVFGCNVSVEDCDINNNAAAGHGGGLCFFASPGSTITRCTISDNDANGRADGGGIFVFGVPPTLIEDCRISRNSASRGGGGVCLSGVAGPISGVVQVRQCLITENTAGEYGGGISCKAGVEPRISNCTIADNQVTGAAGVGYGGGLNCSNGSNVEVINSIIWGNFAEQGFQVAVRMEMPGPSTLALSHSDVEGGSGGAYVELGSTLDWGIGAIDSDPQLVDPNGGDWHLGASSPCIDAGDNTAVPPSVVTDLDGNPRIMYGTIDMGAYESQDPFKQYYYVDGVNGSDLNDGLTPEMAFATIQRGINVAEDYDTVLVWPGVYKEEIGFSGDAITVKSAAEAAVVETKNGYAFSFSSAEGPDTVLSNFIIRDSQYGIYLVNGSSPTLSNLTIVNNDFGISAFNGADPDISNCIFWDNIDGDLFREPVPLQARYSCIEEGGEGEGNISIEPGFVDAASGDYHLLSERGRYWPAHDVWVFDDVTSPCVDGGDPAVDPADERMPNGGRINMGAYGNTAYASMSEWPIKGDVDRNGRFNFMDIAILLDDWLAELPWVE
jgi:parallel beta-helix repeat protein